MVQEQRRLRDVQAAADGGEAVGMPDCQLRCGVETDAGIRLACGECAGAARGRSTGTTGALLSASMVQRHVERIASLVRHSFAAGLDGLQQSQRDAAMAALFIGHSAAASAGNEPARAATSRMARPRRSIASSTCTRSGGLTSEKNSNDGRLRCPTSIRAIARQIPRIRSVRRSPSGCDQRASHDQGQQAPEEEPRGAEPPVPSDIVATRELRESGRARCRDVVGAVVAKKIFEDRTDDGGFLRGLRGNAPRPYSPARLYCVNGGKPARVRIERHRLAGELLGIRDIRKIDFPGAVPGRFCCPRRP